MNFGLEKSYIYPCVQIKLPVLESIRYVDEIFRLSEFVLMAKLCQIIPFRRGLIFII